MAIMYNPLQTGEGRVFVNVDGYGVNTEFEFHNCMKIDGLDKSFGDVEPVYCPDPNQYDEFIEIASIRGGDSRWSSNLSGKLPANVYSPLETLAARKCTFNLQIHYGRCTKPSDFNAFDSAIVLRDVRLTSYNLSTLTASNPGERAMIDESGAISASEMYRVLPLTVSDVSGSLFSGGLVGGNIAYADARACASACGFRSDGNNVWIGMLDDAASKFMYTINGGVSWVQVVTGGEVHAGTAGDMPIVVIGDKVYWSIQDVADGMLYASSLSSILAGEAQTPDILVDTLVGSIFKDAATSEGYAWFVSNGTTDAIYAVNNTTDIITTFTPSVSAGFTSVSAYDDDHVLAGTDTDGKLAVSSTFGVFEVITIPGATGEAVESVHMFDENNWIVATDTNIYGTNDAGDSWTTIQAAGDYTRFAFYDEMMGYMATTAGLYRTLDSGNTWKRVYSFTASNVVNIAINPINPNMVFISAIIGGVSKLLKATV